jgi:hypothetical protein
MAIETEHAPETPSFAQKEKAGERVRSALDPVVHVGHASLSLEDPGAL